MRKTILTTGLVLTFAFAVNAQSLSNVEKANRFRTPQTKSAVTVQKATHINSTEISTTNSTINHKSAAQIEELGSRYALAWSRNNAQVNELGSRYALAWSRNGAQVNELGSRYALAWSRNGAQVNELGSRYALAWSRNGAQVNELGSRYALAWSR